MKHAFPAHAGEPENGAVGCDEGNSEETGNGIQTNSALHCVSARHCQDGAILMSLHSFPYCNVFIMKRAYLLGYSSQQGVQGT